MASVFLYLDQRRSDKYGRCPMTMAVSHRNAKRLIFLKLRLTPDEWSNISWDLDNAPRRKWTVEEATLDNTLYKYNLALRQLRDQYDLTTMNVTQIRSMLVEIVDGKPYAPARVPKRTMFLAHYRKYMEHMKDNGTRRVYGCTLSKILKFDPEAEAIPLDKVSPEWLSAFDAYMTPTVSPNIRNLYFRNIRAVMNDAIKLKLTMNYPFKAWKLPKLEETRNRALTKEQVVMLRDVECDAQRQEYRDMWLLSLYLIGVNMTDLLHAKPTDIEGDRLVYRRAKTGRMYSIRIEPEAQEIIDRYRGEKYLLCPLDRYGNHEDYLKHMNNGLKTLGMTHVNGARYQGTPLFPKLTSYWARHTWSTLASELDHSIEVIGRCLGHAWVEHTVTSIYIRYNYRKIDEANRAVLDALK